MPKVNFVESARKNNPVANVGEPYYWWKFRYGGKHYSKTPPRASQLTQSEFLSTVREVEESFIYLTSYEEWRDAEELKALVEEAVSRIQEAVDQAQESLDNMPENLQYGSIREMLQSRVDEGQAMIEDYESVDFDGYDGPNVPEYGLIPDEFMNWVEERIEELESITYGGE